MSYSPKISENLISPLYHLAKSKKIPMTKLVNSIIEKHLSLELVPVKCSEYKFEVYSSDQNKEAS
jgi:hypothetical protein